MTVKLTTDEIAVLRSLPWKDDDGWPLCILADPDQVPVRQLAALSLLKKGLIAVFGRSEDTGDLPAEEAATILDDSANWSGLNDWHVYLTPDGNAALAGLD